MTTTSAPRLPGQAAAPPGPCDLTAMLLMHHGFRRDLADLAAAVPHTPLDDRRTWSALRERWRRMTGLLHHHHTEEDLVLWPLLRERADGAGLAVLDAMEAEHDLIDPLLDRVTRGFEHPVDRDALAADLAETRRVLGAHLDHEEREALPLVQRLITAAEWVRLEEQFRGEPDLGTLRFQLPWMTHGVDDAVWRPLATQAGVPFLVLHALTRPGFLRRHRRAFRYLP